MDILVEGWRFIPHSYAIVNQFQLLELMNRPQLRIFHRDMPYFQGEWEAKRGLLSPAAEAQLDRLPSVRSRQHYDATLRMFLPYDLSPGESDRTYVFGTTEWSIVQKLMVKLMGVSSFAQAHRNSETVIITPSTWSRLGFLRGGAVPERVVVLPHGVDTSVFQPLGEAERRSLRQHLGIDNYFVFLNISIMTWNKGIRTLLSSFAQVVERHPQARLILKGSDTIRKSRDYLVADLQELLTPAQAELVIPRIAYIGRNLSSQELACLHQAADVYVAPYLAEGFNMPVLEAAACGLPVICTKGGSTDDFTHPSFTGYIDSQLATAEIDQETRYYLKPSVEHLTSLMQELIDRPEFCAQARRVAPKFVQERYTWRQIVDRLTAILGGDHRINPDNPASELAQLPQLST